VNLLDEVNGRDVRRESSFLKKEDLLALVNSSASSLDGRVEDLRRYVERLDSPHIEVGWPVASSLLDIWRHRYETLDLENTFEGWTAFFDVLASQDGVVGLVGLREHRLIRFIVILNANGDRVLVFLSKSGEYPL
jgi:hypothetical protein